MSGMTRVLLSMMAVALLTAPLSVAAQATFNSPDPRARQETTRRPLVTLDLNRSPLGDVLREIADRVDVRLVYGNDVVPVERRVSVQLRQASLEEALEEALRGTDIAFEFTGSRQVILMQRPEAAPSKPAAAAVGAIRGRVTDAETDHPIGMADIWIEGSNWSTTTNRRGQYLIMGVTVGRHTVSAGRIGYDRRSREITVEAGDTVMVDFALKSTPTQLDAVVATITGEQRVRELGHVVGRVDVDSIARVAPISNISELLTGRVPGLQVMTTSGTVGGEVTMRMRAAVSEELSADPIVIVDGVRYASGTGYDGNVSKFNVEPTSRLNDLNLNDVESIEVVKGPSAATLYGTDAANGVIVIRTKRGATGPARWNAYVRAGMSEIPDHDHPDTWWGWGSATSSCTLYNMGRGFCQQDSVSVVPSPLNDPDLTIFAPKPRMQYGANVSGGREGFNYYFSADYEDATGPIRMPAPMLEELREQLGGGQPLESQLEPNAMGKLNLRGNVMAHLNEDASVRVDVGYTQSDTRQMSFGNPYTSAYRLRPANVSDDPYGTGTSSPLGSFSRNSTETLNRFMGSASVEWTPLDWLRTRGQVGLDMPNTHRYSLGMRDAYDGYDGDVGEDRYRALNTTADLGATATFQFDDISSRTSVGAQYYRRYGNRLVTEGTDLRPGGTSVIDAARVTSDQSYRESVTLGSYLEQVFGYDERLFLTGAVRVDGASSFGHDFKTAAYPKAGVSWVVSEESFIPDYDWLGNVRLRYAFGASGQQPRPDMRDFLWSAGQAYYGGGIRNKVTVDRLPSPDLRPERIREHEWGFDLSLLDDRLRADVTWSRRAITDQIRAVTLPQAMGTTWTNVGFSTGKGFEALLNARIVDTRAVSFDITATHATNSTMLEDLGGMPADYTVYGGLVEGFPLGARFMREIESYEDANGNGYLELEEVVMTDTAVYAGRGTPAETQALTAVLGLFNQRVRLSALVDRQAEFSQFNYLAMYQRFGGARAGVDATAPLEDQAKIIATYHYGTTAQPATGYFELEPGDHTRLREVSLAVAFPEQWVEKMGLRDAHLSVSGRNLFLWSDYNGPDPGVGRFNNNFGMYSDNIPHARSWVVRMDVGF